MSNDPTNHSLWVRMGVILHTTPEEADTILRDSTTQTEAAELVRQILSEGRFSWDGNSYIPYSVIEQYNQINDTTYDPKDIEWEI